MVLFDLHHIHNDPSYWKDPETFRPERFLTPCGQLRKDDHLLPFGTGEDDRAPGEGAGSIRGNGRGSREYTREPETGTARIPGNREMKQ